MPTAAAASFKLAGLQGGEQGRDVLIQLLDLWTAAGQLDVTDLRLL